MHLAFGAVGAWIEVNKHTINGNPRELYLNLKPPDDDADFVVEVQIPVSKST
jgi:effector-binding domain-containing protein